ncbi:MAG TPA: dynamin family protein [Candidatus Sulfotelmatobacter sp.]|nr:dynamin family protein [Candidatus Sulfotelmatobacter sp.]
MPEESANSLNASHERRLTVTCRYIDKLLADMEGTLHVSESKLAFPHYIPDLSPQQRRVIEDYIQRIRAQLVRVLDGQNIERPSPEIPESRSLHTVLTFIDIAAEELKPEYMRGYGAVPSTAAVELNGIAGELKGLVRQLDQFLMRGSKEDLKKRLDGLEQTGAELALLKRLELIISEHGLVEFRSTLSMIIERLEDNSFEIAIFGRVSSGKSSLLNAILETDVLPVGVTPITAVPTRLIYGESPAVNVWFANRSPEKFKISHLAEFVTEQFNPSNEKHVTRIVAQVPSRRLQAGVAFVDTPGLGSLATSGAAETLAYLPRCDLGVVMIDAGSALTPDDLQTIQTLFQSGIPATVLLSKADLLKPHDCSKVIEYITQQTKRELNIDVNVHPVSVVAEHRPLLNAWFNEGIAPLYSQRQELILRSICRKLGALRQSVERALQVRLRQKDQVSPRKAEQLRVVEAELRQGSGRLEEMKQTARTFANDLEYASRQILRIAGANLAEAWFVQDAEDHIAADVVRKSVLRTVGEHVEGLRRRMDALARKLHEIIRSAAKVLEIEDIPAEDEFASVLRDMPTFDPGQVNIRISKPTFSRMLGTKAATAMLTRRMVKGLGHQLNDSLTTYGALLYDWSERTLAQMQRRFDAYANGYRAQIETFLESRQSGADGDALRRDLEALQSQRAETPVAS